MLFINNEIVDRVPTMDDTIAAQETAFLGLATGASTHRGRIDVFAPCDSPTGYYRWGTMEGANKDLGVFAIRMKSDILHWPTDASGNRTEEKYCIEPGTFCGLIMLFSTRNGEPLAIINDGILQHMRVGGGAGLGAKYLSREDSHIVGMIGSGGMARTYLEAFCCVRDIRQVRVYSPTQANREAYAREMSGRLEIEVVPVDSPQKAVSGADIVSTCTDAINPVIKGEWLEQGQHVTNVGPVEQGDDVLRRGDVVIKQGTSHFPEEVNPDPNQRQYPGSYLAGTDEDLAHVPLTKIDKKPGKSPHPFLHDLLTGKVKGRTSRDQITIYRNEGNQGLQFAAVGAVAYRKARELGLGNEVPTAWFLQDIRD